MKNYQVVQVFKVFLESTLLELHLNTKLGKKKLSINMSIGDDGETISINQNLEWFKPTLLDANSIYSVIEVTSADKLGELLNDRVKTVLYGLSKTLDSNDNVIHYLRVVLQKNEFLFFNNGDEGAYSFDEIDKIVKSDIYQCEWVENIYSSQFLLASALRTT